MNADEYCTVLEKCTPEETLDSVNHLLCVAFAINLWAVSPHDNHSGEIDVFLEGKALE